MAKKKAPLQLARMKCKKSIIGYKPINEGGPYDHFNCFSEGKEYLFCVDTKKNDLFTVDDSNSVHFMPIDDSFTTQHFDMLKMDEAENFGLDEFTLHRMTRLHKERYDFQEY